MHNLATINGSIAMAYQGETPWHGFGHRMPGTANWEDALRAAQLDWAASTHPMYLRDGRQVPDRFAVLRDTDAAILSTVGPAYRIVQYRDAFEIFEPVCKEYGVTIEAAGALGNGSRAWMLAKMPTTIEPIPGDSINGYFLVSTGHDGTTAHTSRPTPIRVVCQNTLDAAVNGARSFFTIRHTDSAKDRLAQARNLITHLTRTLKDTNETYAQLARRSMTPQEVAKYIETIISTPNGEPPTATIRGRRDQIAALVFGGRGSDLANQEVPAGHASAWAAYNAVTEYFDHVRPAEAKSWKAQQAANESAIFGGNATVKLRALTAARELIAA